MVFGCFKACFGAKPEAQEEAKAPQLSKQVSLTREALEKSGGAFSNRWKNDLHSVISIKIGSATGLKHRTDNKPAQCVISFGAQTFKSMGNRDKENPSWEDMCHIFVQSDQVKNKIQVSIYADNTFVEDTFLGGAYLGDLERILFQESGNFKTFTCKLFPEAVFNGATFSDEQALGDFECTICVNKRGSLAREFWHHMFASADVDGDETGTPDGPSGDGQLEFKEFKDLIEELTRDEDVEPMTEEQVNDLFQECDKDNSGTIDCKELVGAMKDRTSLCSDYMLYSFAVEYFRQQEGLENLRGMSSFKTRAQSERGFAFVCSEWMGSVNYDTGLNVDSKAAFVLVKERDTGIVRQEAISKVVNLSMRKAYQTMAGRTLLMLPTSTAIMRAASEKAGKTYDDPHSALKIPGFIEAFKLNMDEVLLPLEEFKTFNDFFCRKLKPEARPIAAPADPTVAVQPADARLMVFDSVSQATELWVKGRNFSLAALLGKENGPLFEGGSLCISRLAPQDYHRFHSPVDGKIASISELMGTEYYTVNPVAINSPVDVFSRNVRKVSVIDSPAFGKVAFINVGAMMVASILFTEGMAKGENVKKGQDLGTFKFGGSTVITVFQKGKIEFDADLRKSAQKQVEVLVRMGTPLGKAQGVSNGASTGETEEPPVDVETIAPIVIETPPPEAPSTAGPVVEQVCTPTEPTSSTISPFLKTKSSEKEKPT